MNRVGEGFRLDPSLSIVLTLAILVAGCGGRSQHAPTADARVAAPPQQHYRAALAPPSQPELEADGLPVQAAPLLRRTKLPDDPNEPFSPNYGRQPESIPTPSPRADIGAQSYPPGLARLTGTHALAAPEPAATHTAAGQTAAAPVHPTRFSLRDLPDDLPPDFRERLIVINGLY